MILENICFPKNLRLTDQKSNMKNRIFICNDSVFHLSTYFLSFELSMFTMGYPHLLYFHEFILLHHGLTFQMKMDQITVVAKYLVIFQRLNNGFCQRVISKCYDDRVQVELRDSRENMTSNFDFFWKMRSLVLKMVSIYGNNWSQAEPDSSSSLTQTRLIFFT